jgi:putative SOS response-associated peptidase YedK
MRQAKIIRLKDAGNREIVTMRWGWPDRWSKTPQDRPKHMHATSETIHEKRTFAASFARHYGVGAAIG